MVEILLLSFALSMDAFAVSLGLGTKYSQNQIKKVAKFTALYCGFLQGLMPLIGFLIFFKFTNFLDSIDHWIAFILLLLIGIKMIYDSFSGEKEEKSCLIEFSHKVLLLLAIATSIDALAAGLTLNVINISPYISVLIIGLVTFIMSYVGVLVGSKFGSMLEKKTGILGGIILVGIGFKILIEH